MMSNAVSRKKQYYLYRTTERAAADGFYLYIASSLSFYTANDGHEMCTSFSCMPTDRLLKETDSSMPTGQTIIDDEDDLPDN